MSKPRKFFRSTAPSRGRRVQQRALDQLAQLKVNDVDATLRRLSRNESLPTPHAVSATAFISGSRDRADQLDSTEECAGPDHPIEDGARPSAGQLSAPVT